MFNNISVNGKTKWNHYRSYLGQNVVLKICKPPTITTVVFISAVEETTHLFFRKITPYVLQKLKNFADYKIIASVTFHLLLITCCKSHVACCFLCNRSLQVVGTTYCSNAKLLVTRYENYSLQDSLVTRYKIHLLLLGNITVWSLHM